MKFQPLLKISAFALILSWSNISVAQEQDSLKNRQFADSVSKSNPNKIVWWLTLGYGASTVTDGEIGAGLGALITVKYDYHFFSARIIHDQGVRDDVFPRQLIFDVGLLYGIGFHRELWFGNASVGVAYTATTKSVFDHINPIFKNEIDKAELYRGIGLAWQLQVFSKFADTSPAGIGLTIFGNVNKSFPFWGFLLSLEFGNF